MMIDVSTLSTLVAAVSVVVGVVFTILEVRHFSRSRRTDIITQIYAKFGTKEMIEAVSRVGSAKYETFEDYMKKYGMTDLLQVALFFEGIGVLLEQNLVDINLVDSLFAPSFSSLWKVIRPLVVGMREYAQEPLMFSHFEYLYERLKSYREDKRQPRLG